MKKKYINNFLIVFGFLISIILVISVIIFGINMVISYVILFCINILELYINISFLNKRKNKHKESKRSFYKYFCRLEYFTIDEILSLEISEKDGDFKDAFKIFTNNLNENNIENYINFANHFSKKECNIIKNIYFINKRNYKNKNVLILENKLSLGNYEEETIENNFNFLFFIGTVSIVLICVMIAKFYIGL